MSEKNNKSDSNNEAFSDSKEMFDSLFGGQETPSPSSTTEKKPSSAEKTSVEKAKPSAGAPAKVSKVKTADTTKRKPDSEEDSFTDSGELLDSLLGGETTAGPSIPKEKKPSSAEKTSVQTAKPSAGAPTKVSKVKTADIEKKKPESEKRPSPKKEKPLDSTLSKKPIVKKVKPPQKGTETKKEIVASDTTKEPTKEKKEEIPLQKKSGKRLKPLIIALSIVVLVALGGLSIHFYGIVDFKKLIGVSKPADKVATPPNVKRKIQDNRISKRVSTPSPLKEKVEAKKETVNIQQTSPTKEIISDLKQKPIEKSKEPPVTDKVISDQKPPKVKEPSKPTVPLQAGKDLPKKTPDIKRKALSYPYSIYLGSFSTLEVLQKALSKYRTIGMSPYWVKVDLGDKGIWYRLYSEYFQTRREADGFIKVKKIPEAEPRKTKYANLIGDFTSEEALDNKRKALLDLKYSPYVISEDKNAFRLYVGAFYQKVRAEKQNADLASKGIQSQLVER